MNELERLRPLLETAIRLINLEEDVRGLHQTRLTTSVGPAFRERARNHRPKRCHYALAQRTENGGRFRLTCFAIGRNGRRQRFCQLSAPPQRARRQAAAVH